MKERSIIFSAPMVRALLDGAKTQTRRVVRHADDRMMRLFVRQDGTPWLTEHHRDPLGRTTLCPYGTAGDRMWVKETIRGVGLEPECARMIEYVADGAIHEDAEWVWRRNALPSMFMPRRLSRLSLEITDVRAERLQDITEADAIAEGVAGRPAWHDTIIDEAQPAKSARDVYRQLWQEINGKRYPWAANPWVWVLTFERVTP